MQNTTAIGGRSECWRSPTYMLPPNASCNRSIRASARANHGRKCAAGETRRNCACRARHGPGDAAPKIFSSMTTEWPASHRRPLIGAKSLEPHEVGCMPTGLLRCKSLDMHLGAEPLMKSLGSKPQETLVSSVATSPIRYRSTASGELRCEIQTSLANTHTQHTEGRCATGNAAFRVRAIFRFQGKPGA